MVRNTSVVTPERFARGFTYQDYLAQIKVNKDWFRQLYDNFQLETDDVRFFGEAVQHSRGPARMLVIGEDWCPEASW